MSTTRAKYGATEYQEQTALVEWCEIKGYPYNLIFAIHNGARVSIGQAMKMKKAGLKKGVPDLFLPWPKEGGASGLFIEMKRGRGGRSSVEQIAWCSTLRKLGYRVETCRGWEAARLAIEKYLEV